MDTDEGTDEALAANRKRRAEPTPQLPAALPQQQQQPHHPSSSHSAPAFGTASAAHLGGAVHTHQVIVDDGMSKRRMSPPPTGTATATPHPTHSSVQQPSSAPQIHQPRPVHHSDAAPAHANAAAPHSGAHSSTPAQHQMPQPHTSSRGPPLQQQQQQVPASDPSPYPSASTQQPQITDENQAPHQRSGATQLPSRSLSGGTPAFKSSGTPRLQERLQTQGAAAVAAAAEAGQGTAPPPHRQPPSLAALGTPSHASSSGAVPEQGREVGRGRTSADGSATPGLREPLRWVIRMSCFECSGV